MHQTSAWEDPSRLAPDGSFRQLGFYSAHLNETQKKYSTFKKELLGAHKSLRHFLPEVYGKHFTIYTDNLPLQQAFHSNNIPLNNNHIKMIVELMDIRRTATTNNGGMVTITVRVMKLAIILPLTIMITGNGW